MFHECYEYIPHKVINTRAAACSGWSCFLLRNYCRQQFGHSMQLWHSHKLAASAVGVGLCQMTSAVAVARWEQCTSVGIVLRIAAMHHSCLMALHFDTIFGAGLAIAHFCWESCLSGSGTASAAEACSGCMWSLLGCMASDVIPAWRSHNPSEHPTIIMQGIS